MEAPCVAESLTRPAPHSPSHMGSYGYPLPGFVEGSLPQQRFVDGVAFPKIVFPASSEQSDVAALLESIKESKAWLEDQLYQHGAILFRGFSLKSAEDFNAFSEACGWENMEYVGMATRRKVCDRVYTANEAPAEAQIWFHHEMAQSGSVPSKIMFFCEVEPSEAGETPILLSHKVTEKVQKFFPDFVKNLEEQGLRYTVPLKSLDDQSSVIGKGWQALFGTTNEVEAEKRAATIDGKIEWQSDKSAKLIQGPLQPMRSIDKRGRRVWFNNMTGVYKPDSDNVTFGDGSRLPAEAVYGCERIMEEEAVDIPWRRGDVMLLDNLAVMHGKRAAKPPRRVLVSICK